MQEALGRIADFTTPCIPMIVCEHECNNAKYTGLDEQLYAMHVFRDEFTNSTDRYLGGRKCGTASAET